MLAGTNTAFGKAFSIPRIQLKLPFSHAGHDFGVQSIVKIKIKGESQTKHLVFFQGDLGKVP